MKQLITILLCAFCFTATAQTYTEDSTDLGIFPFPASGAVIYDTVGCYIYYVGITDEYGAGADKALRIVFADKCTGEVHGFQTNENGGQLISRNFYAGSDFARFYMNHNYGVQVWGKSTSPNDVGFNVVSSVGGVYVEDLLRVQNDGGLYIKPKEFASHSAADSNVVYQLPGDNALYFK